jgi:transcriptional regulator with XRE-family HTH domain
VPCTSLSQSILLFERNKLRAKGMALTTNRQLRAARALLGWEQDDLALAAKVSAVTIRRMEKAEGALPGRHETVQKLQRALEMAGVLFTARGVELREQAAEAKAS